MIPLKQTPEEQRAGWADYCRRRNWARLSTLSVAAFFVLLGRMTPYLPSKLESMN
jgi:hypothetical protein